MINVNTAWSGILAFMLAIGGGLALMSCTRGDRSVVSFESAVQDLQSPAFGSPRLAVSDMFSTYDRMGGNMDWADLNQLWIGDLNYLAVELKGPGCVRRIWSTNVASEEWLFYFDGETTPRLKLPESKLFVHVGQGSFPFLPPLTESVSGGSSCYIPFPYQKSLRIVWRMKQKPAAYARPYFHVNYDTYPSGTRVASFPKTFRDADRAAVEKVRQSWTGVESQMRARVDSMEMKPFVIPSGGTAEVFKAVSGPGAINAFSVRLGELVNLNAVQRAQALRNLVLRSYWDGASVPSVEVPLGDFFCNGLHQRRFASFPMANVEGTWICRFPMPFRNGARIEIGNEGPFPVDLKAAVDLVSGEKDENVRYFHAAWNQAYNSTVPLRVMRTEGKGSFMGCYVIALGMDGGWNILEGDEKFFRDGALRPVHHGTGLEDYFNAGWYYFGLFERPLSGLLEKAVMRTAQYRFQIPDPVTFEKSLMMQLEFGDANRAKGYMSAASYWYQDKPGPAGSTIPPADQRVPAMDRVGVAASMCELFELERAGLGREAEERSEYYATLFGNDPLGQIYALRALAYREIREGAPAVREAYRTMAETPGVAPEVAAQAKLLLWRSEKANRALFGGSAYSTFRLFVDGKKIGEGGTPFTYQAFPVELSPGSHLLGAEIDSKGDQAWYLTGFFSDFTNVVSDISWDYSLIRPEGWPEKGGDSSIWKPYAVKPGFFPTMQWWQFTPNAFPCVQSGSQVGGPVGGWDQPAGRTIYLRRRITVPAVPGARCNPFVRCKEIDRTPAVRPANDTSNEGLSR